MRAVRVDKPPLLAPEQTMRLVRVDKPSGIDVGETGTIDSPTDIRHITDSSAEK